MDRRIYGDDYVPDDPTEIAHVDAVLKLLAVMTGDRRYEAILAPGIEKEVKTMCGIAEKLEQKGRAEERKALVAAVRRLQAGETMDDLIESGVDRETVEIAVTLTEK